jgi:hypothetical protein
MSLTQPHGSSRRRAQTQRRSALDKADTLRIEEPRAGSPGQLAAKVRYDSNGQFKSRSSFGGHFRIQRTEVTSEPCALPPHAVALETLSLFCDTP